MAPHGIAAREAEGFHSYPSPVGDPRGGFGYGLGTHPGSVTSSLQTTSLRKAPERRASTRSAGLSWDPADWRDGQAGRRPRAPRRKRTPPRPDTSLAMRQLPSR